MKNTIWVILLLLLGGCLTEVPAPAPKLPLPPIPLPVRSTTPPPFPPLPNGAVKLAPRTSAAAAVPVDPTLNFTVPGDPPPPLVPQWVFANVGGNYIVDVSTNLIEWVPLAVVYSATNITLKSNTLGTRPVLFYRLRPMD